jgi:general L-amino acid transport system substrate-binding protein
MNWIKHLNGLAPLAGALALSMGLQSLPAWAQLGPLTDRIKARGELICGVNNQLPGFGNLDDQGKYVGFDIDICRAVAAALFGDPDKVRYVYLTAANRQSAISRARSI